MSDSTTLCGKWGEYPDRYYDGETISQQCRLDVGHSGKCDWLPWRDVTYVCANCKASIKSDDFYERNAQGTFCRACCSPMAIEESNNKMKIDKMIEAIEKRACIRKLWRCRVGWGMAFIREHAEPTRPGPMAGKFAHAEWDRERKKIEEDHTVVAGYHPSLKACVRAEYNRVVKLGIDP